MLLLLSILKINFNYFKKYGNNIPYQPYSQL